jgi:hypothetical protein
MIWLDKILSQLNFISKKDIDQAEPDSLVDVDDHIVGDVPEEVKKMFALTLIYKKTSAISELMLSQIENVDKLEQAIVQISEANRNAETLKEICWRELCEVFKLSGKDEIYVRKGWVVVWREDPDAELLALMDEILENYDGNGDDKIM